MTDHELLSLGIDMLANLQSLFTNYMTLLFAFIVTSFLVAHKLDRAMAVVVIVLFTALASSQLMEMLLVNMDVDALSEQLRARVAAGSEATAWHGLTHARWQGDFITIMQLTSAVGGYFAALFFFFHQRRRLAGVKSDEAQSE